MSCPSCGCTMVVARAVGVCPHTGEAAVVEHYRCHCGHTEHISIAEGGLRMSFSFMPLNRERGDE